MEMEDLKTKSVIQAQETDIAQWKHETQTLIKSHETEITKLNNKLAEMETNMGHVENGSLTFNNIGSWSSDNGYQKGGYFMTYKDMTVKFAKAYPRPPVVTWSFGHIHRSQKYNMYSVDVVSVTPTEFTLRVGVYRKNSDYHFYVYIVHWFSLPR